MSGEWKDETNYFNDEYIVDFVAYKGALLSCSKSHLSSATTEPVLIKIQKVKLQEFSQMNIEHLF